MIHGKRWVDTVVIASELVQENKVRCTVSPKPEQSRRLWLPNRWTIIPFNAVQLSYCSKFEMSRLATVEKLENSDPEYSGIWCHAGNFQHQNENFKHDFLTNHESKNKIEHILQQNFQRSIWITKNSQRQEFWKVDSNNKFNFIHVFPKYLLKLKWSEAFHVPEDRSRKGLSNDITSPLRRRKFWCSKP
jgi:hypothetical protein